MNLIKYKTNPFTSFFDDFWGETLTERRDFSPRANIYEDKDAYHVSLDLPGLTKEDVKVEMKENLLTVAGERKNETSKDIDGYRHYESSYGKFERSWVVGDGIDAAKIQAEVKDGVLKIDLPKKEEEIKKNETRQISIK